MRKSRRGRERKKKHTRKERRGEERESRRRRRGERGGGAEELIITDWCVRGCMCGGNKQHTHTHTQSDVALCF